MGVGDKHLEAPFAIARPNRGSYDAGQRHEGIGVRRKNLIDASAGHGGSPPPPPPPFPPPPARTTRFPPPLALYLPRADGRNMPALRPPEPTSPCVRPFMVASP